mmetsp:Transcript_582/g.974  ORF Transcript_582/g.974 Transcript_582/m.974 type:complete len:120 (-) Transcript_582:831-1190(-)
MDRFSALFWSSDIDTELFSLLAMMGFASTENDEHPFLAVMCSHPHKEEENNGGKGLATLLCCHIPGSTEEVPSAALIKDIYLILGYGAGLRACNDACFLRATEKDVMAGRTRAPLLSLF